MSGLLSIYDVACPYCGARAGSYCHIKTGTRPILRPHALRVIAFRRERDSDTTSEGGTT